MVQGYYKIVTPKGKKWQKNGLGLLQNRKGGYYKTERGFDFGRQMFFVQIQ